MTKCYLLGAGASYGYDDSLPKEQRFPLTDEFFLKGRDLGLLNSENFPELTKQLALYLTDHKQNPEDFRCDVEDYLSWLCVKAGTIPDQSISFGDSVVTVGHLSHKSNDQEAEDALGQCYYFIYELMRRLSLNYFPKFDNYRRLALHFLDEHYSVITLNYDLLFEMACDSIQIPYSYGYVQPSHLRHIKLTKMHGSINWVNQMFGSNVVIDQPPAEMYKQVVSNLYRIRYQLGNVTVLGPDDIRTMTYKDIAVCGHDCYEPLIIPPLHEYKNYEKVKLYEQQWQSAKQQLVLADQIIIIGCAIRPQDNRIQELLKDGITENKHITICDPDYARVKSQLPKVNKIEMTEYSSFTDYAKTL